MAYAALLSLAHILEQTLKCDFSYLHPHEKEQIASFLDDVSFLLDFLDNSSPKSGEAIESLENQIRDAAYKAEDIIESCITDRILEKAAGDRGESFPSFFYHLQKVITEIDSIKKRADKIKGETDVQDLQQTTSLSDGSSRLASSDECNTVGLDEDVMEIKDQLTGGSPNLEIVSVVGMGGIGKTTLAKKVYVDELIVYHFHIRAWVTVTQDYGMQKIFLDLMESTIQLTDEMREQTTEQLQELLYKSLKGRKYFIVIDDVWNTDFWDDVKRCFPNDGNGSRIMMTTRLGNLASYVNSRCPPHHMRFLNEDESWTLFSENVFGRDSCPSELVHVGKKIAQNCQGLPLAVIVIAGLLLKGTETLGYWTSVGESLSSVISSNDEQCSKIISLSYKHLPHHLKGCFLYMGIFPEDFIIPVSKLVKLWVAEGLLKSVRSKSLEDVAEEYLLELVDRNLILISQHNIHGKIKTCKIHDLIRDLCVREAEKEKFYIRSKHLHRNPEGFSLLRLSINSNMKIYNPMDPPPCLFPRSVLNFDPNFSVDFIKLYLLRILLDTMPTSILHYSIEMEELVNTRYLECSCSEEKLPLLVYKLRNLQTLILHSRVSLIYLEPKIWKMRQLRHVQLGKVILPDPPPNARTEGENFAIVLENLQTFSTIRNFRCTEEVLQRIPNLKKLGIFYEGRLSDWGYYCLKNLVRLHKLEELKCAFQRSTPFFLKNLTFPVSIKKLSLSGSYLPWKDMTIVGALPNLQVLKLKFFAFDGPVWEPIEGEFLQLKYLFIENLGLEYWRADSIHFPTLKHLFLKDCYNLEEIPRGIGEIPTLESIDLNRCIEPLVISVMEIQEEQQCLGNDGLRVRIEETIKYS